MSKRGIPIHATSDDGDEAVSPSQSGVKRRLPSTDDAKSRKRARVEEEDEDGHTDEQRDRKGDDRELKQAEKEAKINKARKNTSLSDKPRITQKDNKGLKKPIDWLSFDTTKSSIPRWTVPKELNKSTTFSHAYDGYGTFCAKYVGVIDKQPIPTMHNGLAIRLTVKDPKEKQKFKEIDGHFDKTIRESAEKHLSTSSEVESMARDTVLTGSTYVPLLEQGQPKNPLERKKYAKKPIPPSVACFDDTFKIAVDFSKDKKQQLSRCYDKAGKAMHAVNLKRGNKVVATFTLGFGTLYGKDDQQKRGLTPHLVELHVLDDKELSFGRENEFAGLDDEELSRLRAENTEYLPESSLDKEPELPTFVSAAKNDTKDVSSMTAPAPLNETKTENKTPVINNDTKEPLKDASKEKETKDTKETKEKDKESKDKVVDTKEKEKEKQDEKVKDKEKPTLTKSQQMMQKKQEKEKEKEKDAKK